MAVHNLGTVRPGSTVHLPWHTFDSNDPSASVTITGLALADILVYKNGSVTERASTAGFALLDTDGIDFDAKVGIHGVSVDLSDNTTAGFYEGGARYWVVIDTITVDAASVRFVLAEFTIGYEGALLNTSIATLSTQTSFTLTDGPAENDALNGCRVVIHDVASAVQWGSALITDYVGATKTVTLSAGTTFTAAASDNIAIFPPALLPTVAGNTIDVTATGAAGIDWGNVENPTTAVDLSGTDIQLADTVTTLTGHTAQTGDNYARLGAPAGASMSADIAAAKADTAAILVDTGTSGVVIAAGQTVDTVTTLTGHTAQTGDSFARLGAPAGASVSADIAAAKVDTAAILVDTGTSGVVIAAGQTVDTVTTLTGHTAQTGDSFARLGAPAGVSVSADIAAVKVDTAATLVDTGTSGVVIAAGQTVDTVTTLTGHTAQTGDSFARLGAPAGASVSADVAAVKVDTAATLDDTGTAGVVIAAGQTVATATTVTNEVTADVTKISGDATAADRLEAMMDGVVIAQVNDASATTTAFAADGFTETTDDHYNGRLVTFISGALSGQQTDITGYDAAGGAQGSQQFTVTALTEAPGNNDFFVCSLDNLRAHSIIHYDI